METKFKVGDKVELKKNVKVGGRYNEISMYPGMVFIGTLKIIALIDTDDETFFYRLENEYGYSEEMLQLKEKTMKYAFKIGDKVKVIKGGCGISSEELGSIYTIIELGSYSYYPGYKVNPPIGNMLTGSFKGFIAEESFELALPYSGKLSGTWVGEVKIQKEKIHSDTLTSDLIMGCYTHVPYFPELKIKPIIIDVLKI